MKISSISCCLILSFLLFGCGSSDHDKNQESLSAPPAAPTSTAQIQGLRANFTITANSTGYTLKNLLTLINVEYPKEIKTFVFDDLSVNLTIATNAATISNADLTSLLELYIAYFNRAPDADGLNYWIDQFKTGLTLDQIGASFYSAAITNSVMTGYAINMSNDAFVRVIYKNVLGRDTPDQEGLNYWVSALASGGETRGTLIKTMLSAAHGLKTDPTYGWVHNLLVNKTTVGNYIAVQNGITFNTVSDIITKGVAIAAAVTPSDITAAMGFVNAFLPALSPVCIAPQVLQAGICATPTSELSGLDNQKTLIALINFPDNNNQTVSLDKVKNLIINDPLSLNKFIYVNSNGKVSIDAKFVNWTTMSKNSNYYFNQNQLKNNEFHNDVVTELSKTNDLRSIKRLILIVKDGFQGNPGCYAYQDKFVMGNAGEYAGYLMVLGGYDMGCLNPGRIAHEYGHTFGFGHSLESLCNVKPSISLIDQEYLNSCQITSAYSWTFDTMGSDQDRPLYSSVWRAKAGWFDESQISTVTTSGIYTLEQSELASNGVKLIKIPLGHKENGDVINYYIEYRKKLGDFDPSYFNKISKEYVVTIRIDDIKTSTNDLFDFGKDVLSLGKDYTDLYRDLKVSVLSIDGTGEHSSVRLFIEVPKTSIEPSNSMTFNNSSQLEKKFFLRNTSLSTLNVSATGVSGRNPDAFKITQDQCIGVTLAPNQACSIVVTRINQDSVLAYAFASINNGTSLKIVELQGNKITITPTYDPNIKLDWQNIGVSYGKNLTWQEAISYCDNLTLNDMSDWRLPRIEELRNTFQLTSSPLFIINGTFWSISEVQTNPLNAYSINGNGESMWQNGVKSMRINALCVRNR